MKKVNKGSGNILFIYKVYSKCKKDSILLIYGLIIYFISGFLAGIFFHHNTEHYFLYAFAVNFLPIIFLYFAGIFTKDKSKLKLTSFALFWGIIAYVGTIMGEYFKSIIDIMFMLSNEYSVYDSFITARISLDTFLVQYTSFSGLIGEVLYKFMYINHEGSHHLLNLDSYATYASIYLESSRIFTIVVGTILVSDYFLSAKKYLNFISKTKSLNKDNNNNIYYNHGLISTGLPITIRPKAFVYLLPLLILILCSIYAVYSIGIYNVSGIYFLTCINISVYFIILLILEFNKVKFNLDIMSWHDNLDIKNTRLQYKNITSVDIETGIANTMYKQILIYSNVSKKPYRIQTKFLDRYKISKIVRIISEKAPNAKLSYTAETIRREEIIITKMKTNLFINAIVYFFMFNITITIILTF